MPRAEFRNVMPLYRASRLMAWAMDLLITVIYTQTLYFFFKYLD